MSDSTSDEHQADDHRGGFYASTTLSWVRRRDLNFGPSGTWREPRRIRYEYNWTSTGATGESLISSGQHTPDSDPSGECSNCPGGSHFIQVQKALI